MSEVTFAIEPGEFVALVGPSGCGKSTLLLLTAGADPSQWGSIIVSGDRVAKPRSDVGVAFQHDLLLEWAHRTR